MAHIKKKRGGVQMRLEPAEAALVRGLLGQLLEMLGDPPETGEGLAALGIAEDAALSDDPVIARLFPDAYRDDGEAAGEFRRYTELGLRDGKREAADVVLATLGDDEAARVDALLDEGQARAWLKALNDLRLALGTRLDIGEDWYEQVGALDRDDPRLPMFAAYDWLTAVQEDLVHAVW
ncbi:DUF2017 domain-containing protein [Actinomadura parmotrematis]|uniref:DUF2017 domain-containing protein n=1 Tax=Actinomadura parmotrematis TaxID=2864039 RepID=A0ABS7FTX0_9ACTN|nr:DUF2017 domain-containing protein [Actinomadura parmotrematis]MBW8483843.1 DUF2017 domain-containing protein [Actinomadura parmotrematis]